LEGTKVTLTYFEIVVAFVFWYFAGMGVEYAVMEVGLGGLLDGTNVVKNPAKVCIITDIGYDHMHVLGHTLEEIAFQKAGIIQPRNHVFMYNQGPEVMGVVKDTAAQRTATLHVLETDIAVPDFAKKLPLYQQRNFTLAYETTAYALERDGAYHLDAGVIEKAAHTFIPGRMETVEYQGKTIIFDGAHNAQKLSTLSASLKAKYPDKAIATLLAMVKSPSFESRADLQPITEISGHIIVTGFGGERDDMPKTSVSADELATYVRALNYTQFDVEPDTNKAFQMLLDRPEPILLVTGSIYLMQHIRPQLPV
jgi:dihydrofolate synthase/folylpolyglutamate synthase